MRGTERGVEINCDDTSEARAAAEIFLGKLALGPQGQNATETLCNPDQDLGDAEAEMNAFLRGHRVLAVKKEFVPDGENSFWTFCVEYLDGTAPTAGGGSPGPRPPKVDYKELLKPEEFEVFSRLRDWRKAAAEKEGLPVYLVLTNEQLAQMVKNKSSSKAALKEIEGVGDARVEKYGDALLQLLAIPVTPAKP